MNVSKMTDQELAEIGYSLSAIKGNPVAILSGDTLTADFYECAAKTIAALLAEIRRLQALDGWTSVNDSLPPINQRVLVTYDVLESCFSKDRKVVKSGIVGVKNYFEYNPYCAKWDDEEYHRVTHWRPLPEPPEESHV